MSLLSGVRPPHVRDDDLIRLIDRQLDLEGSRRVRGHLQGCADCQARLDALRAESEFVAGWIREVPVALPDDGKRALALAAVERARFRRRPFASAGAGGALLKVAASIAVLVAVALGTTPGRSWVGDRVEALVGPNPGPLAARVLQWLDAGPPPVAAPARGARAALASPGDSAGAPARLGERRPAAPKPATRPLGPPPVRFEPEGPEVLLEFESLQAAGAATLVIGESDDASARIVAGNGGEKLVEIPGGLEIRNRPESRAEYRIEVPTRFRLVRIRVAKNQEMLIRVTPGRQPWLWTINLQDTALR
jgi:hypothetical protein